jgi:excisionase family DNA binding protein
VTGRRPARFVASKRSRPRFAACSYDRVVRLNFSAPVKPKQRRIAACKWAIPPPLREWQTVSMHREQKPENRAAVIPAGDRECTGHSNRPDARALGFVKVAYSVGEACDLLSIGRSSLYAAVKRGELKRVKVGRKTLLLAGDLAAFLMRLDATVEPTVGRARSVYDAARPASRKGGTAPPAASSSCGCASGGALGTAATNPRD